MLAGSALTLLSCSIGCAARERATSLQVLPLPGLSSTHDRNISRPPAWDQRSLTQEVVPATSAVQGSRWTDPDPIASGHRHTPDRGDPGGQPGVAGGTVCDPDAVRREHRLLRAVEHAAVREPTVSLVPPHVLDVLRESVAVQLLGVGDVLLGKGFGVWGVVSNVAVGF